MATLTTEERRASRDAALLRLQRVKRAQFQADVARKAKRAGAVAAAAGRYASTAADVTRGVTQEFPLSAVVLAGAAGLFLGYLWFKPSTTATSPAQT